MHTQELLIETTPYIPPARALESLEIKDAERRLPGTNHSIAEIVAHMDFWQDWFCRRCTGIDAPMVAKAAHGWPSVSRGTWPEVQVKFLAGLERAAAIGKPAGSLQNLLTPAIQFPPLAHYTIGDALVHVSNHNAYHLGQVVVLRQLLGLWPPPSGSWTW